MSSRQRKTLAKRRRHDPGRRSTSRRAANLGGATLGATLAMSGAAQAVTFTVTTATDPATGTAANCTAGSTSDPNCSLRDAFAAVGALSKHSGADTITFASSVTGAIHLSHGQLGLGNDNNALSIVGPGAGALTIDGSGQTVSSFNLYRDSGVTLSGLTLSGAAVTSVRSGNGGAIRMRPMPGRCASTPSRPAPAPACCTTTIT
jgi:hypothetical protein